MARSPRWFPDVGRCVIRSGPRGVHRRPGDLSADPFVIQENLVRLHVCQLSSMDISEL